MVFRRLHFLCSVVCLLLLPAARAQVTLYWDTDGATPGLGNSVGSWNAAHWSTSSSGDVATGGWVNGSIASFNAFGGAGVSLDANVTAAGLSTSASGGLSLSGAGILTLSPGAIIHNASSMDLNVSIAGTAAAGSTAFTVDSLYPVYFHAANTYTGQTVINGGDIALANGQSLGANGAGNETIFTAGGGQFLHFVNDMTLAEGLVFTGYRYLTTPNNSLVTLAGPIVLQGGGSMGLWSGDNLTITGVISESGGAGTFAAYATLTGINTFTGALQVGRVVVNTFNNAGVAGPLGAGASVQLGYDYEGSVGGELIYTGATATTDRAIQLYAEGTVTVDNPATTLTLNGVISNEGSAFAEPDPNFNKAGPGTLILKGNNTFTGDTYVTNGTLIIGNNAALGPNVESEVELGTNTTSYDDDLALLLESGITLTKYVDVYNENDDGGSTTLGLFGTGAATFAEEVYIQRDIDVSVGAGGVLNFSEIFNDGNGGGGITKIGAGRAVFTGGIDLRGGGLNVQAGELAFSQGSVILAQSINVGASATLAASGLLTSSMYGQTTINVDAGGKLSVGGDTAAVLTTPGLHLLPGSDFKWQLASLTAVNQADWDRVVVDGLAGDQLLIEPGAQLTVDLSLLGISSQPLQGAKLLNDPFWQTAQVWVLIDFTGAGTNTLVPGAVNPFTVTNYFWPGGVFDTFVGGGTGDFAGFAAGDVFLRFTPVPEPATYALLGLGAVAVLLPRRRRR